MITKSDKEAILVSLKESFSKADAIFLTNLIGMTSNDAVMLRKEVRKAGGKIVVTRNTLFRRATEGTQYAKLLENLKGPSAIAFSFKDAPGVAKAIYDASKTNEVIQLRGGYLGAKSLTSKDVEALAKLPSREQMLATLLATFNAPASAFVRVLNAIKEKKEQQ